MVNSGVVKAISGCLLGLVLLGAHSASAQPRVGINGDTCKWDTITEALAEAKSGDQVFVAAGNYLEQPGLIDQSLTLSSATADCRTDSATPTTVNGQGNAGGIFRIDGGNDTIDVTFRRFSLVNGNSDKGGALSISNARVTLIDGSMSSSSASDVGGCALIDRGALTMDDSNASFCSAGSDGGAFYVIDGSLDIVSNSFIQNGSFASRNGGAIAGENADVLIRDSSMQNNDAGVDGGAIHLSNGSSLTISNSFVEFNDAVGSGGGVYADNSSVVVDTSASVGANTAGLEGGGMYLSNASLNATASTMASNTAFGEGGGSIRGDDSDLTLTDMTFVGNTATFDGGAIWLTGAGASLSMTGGAVALNQTTTQGSNRGGGGMFVEGSNLPVTLNNVDFIDNSSSNSGGALELKDGVQATIDQCEFSGNSAITGGAIIVFGVTTRAEIDLGNFVDNVASLNGGAIDGFLGQIVVSRSDFTNNIADFGGAISTVNAPELTITDSDFDQNQATTAASGGGGAVNISHLGERDAIFSISDSSFSQNQSSMFGGAISFYGGDDSEDVLNVTNTDFSDNSTGESGGAIYLDDVTTLTVTGGSFTDNSTTQAASNQGGGAIYATSSGQVSVTDAQASGNVSVNLGGAFAMHSGTDLAITGGSVSNNTADLGGGVYQAQGDFVASSALFSANMTTSSIATGGSIYLVFADFDIAGTTVQNSTARFGAGLFAWLSDGVIENSRFVNNSASEDGGGIRLFGTELTIRSVTTGAAACDPTAFSANTYCTEIRDNSAAGDGGGIQKVGSTSSTYPSILHIDGAAIVGNHAGAAGAAIYTERLDENEPMSLALTNVLIAGSSNGTDMIEAIVLDAGIDAVIDSTTIAANFGEALLANGPDTTLTLANTIFWDNAEPSFASLTGTTTTLIDCNYSEPEQAASWNLGSAVDPQFFTDPDRGDYRLDPVTSPLIDNCLAGPVDDLDGGGRPAGAGWDPGPFEVAALDQAQLLIADPAAGLVTTEAGGTAQFAVTLAKAPTAAVDVPIASNDPAEGSVEETQLTFTPENWDQAQTVMIAGVDDMTADGDQPYSIMLGPTLSLDSAYDSLSADVLATNTDDDEAGIQVQPIAGLVTSEVGATDSFTVRLASQPSAEVTIDVASSDPTEGTAGTAQLTFTSANWDQLQTVTVTGVDDDIVDGDIDYQIELGPVTSGDSAYAALDPADVAVTNTDNDSDVPDELVFADGFE